MCLLYLRIFILSWMDITLCLQKNQLDLFTCRHRKIFKIFLRNQLALCLFHMIRGKTDLFTWLWTKKIREKSSFCNFILLILLKIYLQRGWVWYLHVYYIAIADFLRVCKTDKHLQYVRGTDSGTWHFFLSLTYLHKRINAMLDLLLWVLIIKNRPVY